MRMLLSSKAHSVDDRIRVARADDPCERAADHAADRGGRGRPPEAPALSPPAAAGLPVSRTWADELRASIGLGVALNGTERGSDGSRFGASFGEVRIHHDPRADRLAQGIEARAFTFGRDVYFARGQFDPDSGPGRRLIAHEIGHVQQQRPGAPPALVQRAPASSGSSQKTVPATTPAPLRPSNGPPSTWTDADFEVYLLWALDIQQRPPTALGVRNWRNFESGRAAEYLAGQSAPVDSPGDLIFSAAASSATTTETGTAVTDLSDTTTRPAGSGPATSTEDSRSVQFPAMDARSDLTVRVHSHTVAIQGGAAMSHADAINFLFEHPGAARVEFVFERRVDLLARPKAVVTGVIYQRDAIAGRPSRDPVDAAFAGGLRPTPGQLIDVMRAVEPSVAISEFRYSSRSGFKRRPLGMP